MNCDILIHEASYEDTYANRRSNNMHSCQKDAIRNGKKIQAGLTVLTHIAYSKHPLDVIPDLSEVFTNKNFMAHDFTKINLTQRPVLHLYNDLIYEAFQNMIGGKRINIEKELERYSKYSRNKTMFDY